jgi:hypothetical protein
LQRGREQQASRANYLTVGGYLSHAGHAALHGLVWPFGVGQLQAALLLGGLAAYHGANQNYRGEGHGLSPGVLADFGQVQQLLGAVAR